VRATIHFSKARAIPTIGRPSPSARLAGIGFPWHDYSVAPETLDALLKLSPEDRAELAMILWGSLDDVQREKEFVLAPEQLAELDRRIAEHVADPGSAIPWVNVRGKLTRKR